MAEHDGCYEESRDDFECSEYGVPEMVALEFVKVEHIDEMLPEESNEYDTYYDTATLEDSRSVDEVLEVDPLAPDPVTMTASSIPQNPLTWNSIKTEPVDLTDTYEEINICLENGKVLDEGEEVLTNDSTKRCTRSQSNQSARGSEGAQGTLVATETMANCETSYRSNMAKIHCPICERVMPSRWILDQHLNSHTGERPFECSMCDMKFSWKVSLNKHVQRVHKLKRTFKKNKTVSVKSLEEAVVVQDELTKKSNSIQINESDKCGNPDAKTSSEKLDNKLFQCTVCNKNCRNQWFLNQHMISHSGEMPFECLYCGCNFSLERYLFSHMRNKHKISKRQIFLGRLNFQMPNLKQSSITQALYENNLNKLDLKDRLHKDIRTDPVQCYVCEKTFSSKRYLALHMVTHTREKLFACKFCGKRFTWKHNFETHMQIHEEEIALIFSKEDTSERAVTNQTSEEKLMKTSHETDQMASDKYYSKDPNQLLLSYSQFHNGLYQCKVCRKMFPSQWLLNQHANLHSRKRLLTCTLCPKTFFCNSNLRKHMLIHNRKLEELKVMKKKINDDSHKMVEKSQKISDVTECTRVDKKAINDGEVHKETQDSKEVIVCATKHSLKERFSQCHVCHKKFTQSGNLKRHILIHTGKKPFPCVTCGLSFARKDKLIIHRAKVHVKDFRQSKYALLKKTASGKVIQKHFTENTKFQENSAHLRETHLKRKQKSQNTLMSEIRSQKTSQRMCYEKVKGNFKNVQGTPVKNKIQHESSTLENSNLRKDTDSDRDNDSNKLTNNLFGVEESQLKNKSEKQYSFLEITTSEKTVEKILEGKKKLSEYWAQRNSWKNMKQSESLPIEEINLDHKELSKHMEGEVSTTNNATQPLKKKYECILCPNITYSKADHLVHMQNHMGGNMKSCSICGKELSGIGQLKRHMFLHTGEKPFECLTCGKKFARKDYLQLHSWVHTTKKSKKNSVREGVARKCVGCGKRFYNENALQEHWTQCLSSNSFISPVTRRKQNSNVQGTTHILDNIEKRKNNRVQCFVCKRTFSSKSYLNEHIRIHTGEHPFVCKFCPKKFKFKGLFKHHMKKKHSKKNISDSFEDAVPFIDEKMKSVEKRESVNASLSRKQENEENKCLICGKISNSETELLEHCQKHKNEILYCKICKKTMPSLGYFIKHTCTHVRKKRHLCQVCGKTFAWKESLTKHSKKHASKDDIQIHHKEREEPSGKVAVSEEENAQGNLEKTKIFRELRPTLEKAQINNIKLTAVNMKEHSLSYNEKNQSNVCNLVPSDKKINNHTQVDKGVSLACFETCDVDRMENQSESLKRIMYSDVNMKTPPALQNRNDSKSLKNDQQTREISDFMSGENVSLNGNDQVSLLGRMTAEKVQSLEGAVNNLLQQSKNALVHRDSKPIEIIGKSDDQETINHKVSQSTVFSTTNETSSATQDRGIVQDGCSTEEGESQSKEQESSIGSDKNSYIENEVECCRTDILGKGIQNDKYTKSPSKICRFCKKHFSCGKRFLKHVKNQSCLGPFKCNLCSKKYKYKYYFDKHLLIHHKESTHQHATSLEEGSSLEEPEVIFINSRTPSPENMLLHRANITEVNNERGCSRPQVRFEHEIGAVSSVESIESNRTSWDDGGAMLNVILPETVHQEVEEVTVVPGSSVHSRSLDVVETSTGSDTAIAPLMSRRTETNYLFRTQQQRPESSVCRTFLESQVPQSSQTAAVWKESEVMQQSNNGVFRTITHREPPPYYQSSSPWFGTPTSSYASTSTSYGYLNWTHRHSFYDNPASIPSVMYEVPPPYPGNNVYNQCTPAPPPYIGTYQDQHTSLDVSGTRDLYQDDSWASNKPENMQVQQALTLRNHQFPNQQYVKGRKSHIYYPQ